MKYIVKGCENYFNNVTFYLPSRHSHKFTHTPLRWVAEEASLCFVQAFFGISSFFLLKNCFFIYFLCLVFCQCGNSLLPLKRRLMGKQLNSFWGGGAETGVHFRGGVYPKNLASLTNKLKKTLLSPGR